MFILKEPNKISKQKCWVLNIWTNHLKNTHFWESTSKNPSGSLHIQVTFGFSGFLAHLAAIPTEEVCGHHGQEQRSRISSRNKSSGCCRGRMLSKTTCTMGRLDWYTPVIHHTETPWCSCRTETGTVLWKQDVSNVITGACHISRAFLASLGSPGTRGHQPGRRPRAYVLLVLLVAKLVVLTCCLL